MTTIRKEDFINSIASGFQFISHYHPRDFILALGQAYAKERSPAARNAMAQILLNSKMAAEGKRPICQDTGLASIFLKIGMQVRWDSDMTPAEMVNEGVRRAYNHSDNKLRASVLADPDGARKNTGDNTPAMITYKMVPGDTVTCHVMAKGGGSEAKTKFAMLNPSDSVVDWVLKMMDSESINQIHNTQTQQPIHIPTFS